MLTDKSKSFESTKGFINRRFEDFDSIDQFSQDAFGIFGSALIAKNSVFDMLKAPVINEETRKMQEDYAQRMQNKENNQRDVVKDDKKNRERHKEQNEQNEQKDPSHRIKNDEK